MQCSICGGIGVRTSVESSACGAPTPLYARSPAVRIDRRPGELRLRYAWRCLRWLGPALVCLCWDALLALFWRGLVVHGDPLLAPHLLAPYTLAAIILSYTTLAGLLNRTTVRIAGGRLAVRHGPLPWLGNHSLPLAQVRQLYCIRACHAGRFGSYEEYTLCVLQTDGGKRKLLRGIRDLDDAKFLEIQLERALHIAPRAVAGEV